MTYLTAQVMERVREEQRMLVGAYGPELTPEVLRNMRYTEAVVRETMRMRPIVGGVMRRTARDFELDGHVVPGGMMANILIASMIRNVSESLRKRLGKSEKVEVER